MKVPNAKQMLKNLGITFSFALLVIFLASCEREPPSKTSSAQAPLTLEVGVLIPETGNLAFIGEPMRNAMVLAQDRYEETLREQGLRINLNILDSKGSPKEAITALRSIEARQDLHAVVSGLSGVTEATYPVAESEHLFFVGLTVEPSYFKAGDNAVRVFYSFKREGELLSQTIVGEHWKNVLILYSSDAATSYEVEQVLIPKLESAGVSLSSDTFTVAQKGFTDLVTKYSTQDYDGIVVHGFGIDLPGLVETLNRFPKLAVIDKLGSLGCIDIRPDRRAVMKGVRFFAPSFVITDDALFTQAQSEFASRHPKSSFNYSAVYAYDAYAILAEALREAHSTDPEALRHAMTKPKQALTEVYQFDANGDFAPAVQMLTFGDDGQLAPVTGRAE